jgi:hypothetical protein
VDRLYCHLGEWSHERFVAAIDDMSRRYQEQLSGHVKALLVIERRVAEGRHLAAAEASRPWRECLAFLSEIDALGWDSLTTQVSHLGIFVKRCLAQRDSDGAVEKGRELVEGLLASLPETARPDDVSFLERLREQLEAALSTGGGGGSGR